MAIPYQADYNILTSYKQPEVAPVGKRMTDILTLADLIDKRKANQKALAGQEEVNKILGQGYSEELAKYNAPAIKATQIPAPTAPAIEAQVPTPYGNTAPDTAKALMGQPVEAPQFGENGLPAAPVMPIPEAPVAAPIQPESNVPQAYSFLSPSQYKNFLTVSSHHPDLGMDYLTKLIDQKKKLAEAGLAESKAKAGPTQQQWIERGEEWDVVSAMPPGPEKDAARNNFLYRWAPSVGYNASPESIEQAVKKGTAIETGTMPAKVQTAAATETAKTKAGAEAESEIAAEELPGFRPIPGHKVTIADTKAIKTAEPAMDQLLSGIRELRARYQTIGPKFTGDDAAWYKSRVKELQLLAKGPELYGLGVLAGPDMDILNAVIPDPSSLKEGVGSKVFGDLDVKFKNFEDRVKSKQDTFYRVHGFQKETAPTDTFTVGKVYKDSKGNKAEYQGNGSWKELK